MSTECIRESVSALHFLKVFWGRLWVSCAGLVIITHAQTKGATDTSADVRAPSHPSVHVHVQMCAYVPVLVQSTSENEDKNEKPKERAVLHDCHALINPGEVMVSDNSLLSNGLFDCIWLRGSED